MNNQVEIFCFHSLFILYIFISICISEYNIGQRKDGYLPLEVVLQDKRCQKHRLTEEVLRNIVQEDEKGRYRLAWILEEGLEGGNIIEDGLVVSRMPPLPVPCSSSSSSSHQSSNLNDNLPPPRLYIRANQGHSISGIESEELCEEVTLLNLSKWWCEELHTKMVYRTSTKSEIEDIRETEESAVNCAKSTVKEEEKNGLDVIVAYHGTTRLNWSKIRESGGLSRMTRQHIHMALRLNPENSDDPKRIKITSGFRATSEVALVIDILALLHAKIPIFVSANNVLLSSGTEAGIIPYEYVIKVIDCETGEILTP